MLRKNWPLLVLILLMLIGAFFRLWDLSNIPPGIYPDEAKNANDAITTIVNNDFKVFYPENNGREGLYIWLIALSFGWFGVSIFSLKIVSALAGILTILGTYLLTKEILLYAYKNSKTKLLPIATETIALFSAGLIAVSFWHINFSRIAFRAILVPLLLSFALWLTFNSLRTKKLLPALVAGAIWGIGFYTYIAFRVAILIPIFLITLAFLFYLIENKPWTNKGWLKKICIQDKWWKSSALFLSMGIVLVPIILYFAQNPQDFTGRSSGISVFDTDNPLFSLLKSIGVHIQMLFYQGDGNWRHNFSGEAQLVMPVGILFLAGIVYIFKSIKDSFKEKNWNAIIAYSTLIVSLGVMMLPAALTIEGIPHALRAIGLMPFVFIFASLGFLYLVRLFFPHRHHREEIWLFGFGTMIMIILIFASVQFPHYFLDWGENKAVENSFSKNYVDIGNYFNELPDNYQKYLIINVGHTGVEYPKSKKLPVDGQTTLFIQQTKNIPPLNTLYIEESQLPIEATENSIFIPLNATDEIKNLLRIQYPQGQELEFENFWVYKISKN